LREFLVATRAEGETVLDRGLEHWLQSQPTPGIAIVVSDFLAAPTAVESALAGLAARRFNVGCVRVIGPAERDPSTQFRAGRVVDSESGEQREVRFDAENQRRYAAALQNHLDGLVGFCAARGMSCAIADSTAAIEPGLIRQARGRR
jgi:hypothetical protein